MYTAWQVGLAKHHCTMNTDKPYPPTLICHNIINILSSLKNRHSNVFEYEFGGFRPKLDLPFESCKSNYRKKIYGNWFAIWKRGVCLRCETVKTWENQFRVPKVFGPLWGPQLKLQTRKVSHKFYKTVCFRFENLSARIWNIFLNLHFKFAPSGLFTVWNVILSELFDQRQTFCLQFSCAAASRQRMYSRLSQHSAAGSFPLVLVSFVLPVFRSICLAVAVQQLFFIVNL